MIIKQNRLKMFALAIGSAGIAWLCREFADADWVSGRSAGKMNFAFYIFSFLALVGLVKATVMRGLIAHITPEGLHAPGISNQIIPWEDIEAINAYKGGSLAIKLRIGSPSEGNAKTTAWLGKAVTSSTGYDGYTLALATSGVNAETFLGAVEDAMRGKPSVSRAPASRQSFAGDAPRFGKRAGI